MAFKRIFEKMYYTFRGLNVWVMFPAQHTVKKMVGKAKIYALE